MARTIVELSRRSSDRGVIRFAGILAVAAFLLLVARYWHPIYGFTSLLELGSIRNSRVIAAFEEYPVFVHPGSGYDGQFYAQIAHHPALGLPSCGRRSTRSRTARGGS